MEIEVEELKKIIKEALEEILTKNFEKWRHWWNKWLEKENYLPPPPCIILFTESEIDKFMERVIIFRRTTERLNFLVNKLESWAPQCSEKDKIEWIQREVSELNEKVAKILDLLLQYHR